MAKIEEKGKVTFKEAIKDFFRGYVDFKGRTTRAGYWWATFLLTIVTLTTGIIAFSSIFVTIFKNKSSQISFRDIDISLLIPLLIFMLISIIPSIAMNVRRYRDVGLTGWGMFCLWIIYFLFSQANIGFDPITKQFVSETNSIFTFITTAINIFLVLLTIFPTDMLTVSSKNRILLFSFVQTRNELLQYLNIDEQKENNSFCSIFYFKKNI